MNKKTIQKAALILALSIPLNLAGGCSSKNTKKDEESSISIENVINFTDEDLTNFLIRISAITPVYNLEDIYLNDEEINALMSAAENNQKCDNKVLNCEELYESIIANSINEFGLIATTDEISIEEHQEIDLTIRKYLKEILENKLAKNEISLEDACVIKGLRIIIGKNDSNAWIDYYGKDKALVIDYQQMKNAYNKFDSENLKYSIKDGLKKCIELGLEYPRIQTCDCRLEKGQTNLSIGEGNVLACLIDTAIHNNDYKDLGILNQIIFEHLGNIAKHNTSVLLLLASFKENRNIDDLYQIIFDSDLEGLYKYFDLTTKEDIAKFYQITRTMEVITTSNEYQEEFYENTTSPYPTAFRDYVGYGYKADIFKLSITDLMQSIASSKDINKEEAMFLYKYVKHIILNNTGLNNNYYEYEENFAKTIIAIENIYFDFLSKFYNLSLEELNELYNDTWLFEACLFEKSESTYNIDFSKLIAKYPLLQFIETNYFALSSYIDNFDEEIKGR